MTATAPTIQTRSLSEPDEVREADKARIEVMSIGGTDILRITVQPGWKWSESIKPIAGTDTCQIAHVGYCVSGSLHIMMDDGGTAELTAGDAFTAAPGHDAWVTSEEPCVFLEFSPSAQMYATPQ